MTADTRRTWIAAVLVALLAILAAVSMAGCGDVPPARGSAQDQAASAAGRADASATAADAAAVDAARAQGRADELERQAVAKPTPELIKAAADARVDAAAKAAVATALRQVADGASQAAAKSAEEARREREAEAQAQDDRSWLRLCRWIGLAGVVLGGLLGGALGYFAGRTVGILAGGLIAGTGMLVVAFGATITWLPLVLGGAVLAGGITWAIVHRKERMDKDGTTVALLAASHVIDAVEGTARATAGEAKAALAEAAKAARLTDKIKDARSTWKVEP